LNPTYKNYSTIWECLQNFLDKFPKSCTRAACKADRVACHATWFVRSAATTFPCPRPSLSSPNSLDHGHSELHNVFINRNVIDRNLLDGCRQPIRSRLLLKGKRRRFRREGNPRRHRYPGHTPFATNVMSSRFEMKFSVNHEGWRGGTSSVRLQDSATLPMCFFYEEFFLSFILRYRNDLIGIIGALPSLKLQRRKREVWRLWSDRISFTAIVVFF